MGLYNVHLHYADTICIYIIKSLIAHKRVEVSDWKFPDLCEF